MPPLLPLTPAARQAADALFRQGTALAMAKNFAAAEQVLRQAIARDPSHADAQNNLGNVLRSLQRPDEALAAYRAALALRPDMTAARFGAGAVLEILGHQDEARGEYEACLAQEPGNVRFHHALALCKRFAPDDPQIAALQRLAEAAKTPAERILLHFSLGKAFHETNRPAEAFAQWQKGNGLVRAQSRYDVKADAAVMAKIAAAYGAGQMAALAGLGVEDETPVFIVGLPRSGSTLLEQMLASHPAIAGIGESPAFALAARAGQLGDLLQPSGFRQEALLRTGSGYVAELNRAVPKAERVVNKLLGNFLMLGAIHTALPKARILHLRRNPRDLALSCYATLFSAFNPFAYDLGEMGQYLRAYDGLMAHWRAVLPPDVFLELDYETLVADGEGQMQRVVEFLALPWDAACLDFHVSTRAVYTASVNQVREPLHRRAVGSSEPYAGFMAPFERAYRGERG